MLLAPDATVRAEQEASERDRLAEARARMTAEDLGLRLARRDFFYRRCE